jgi:hypothetical protein
MRAPPKVLHHAPTPTDGHGQPGKDRAAEERSERLRFALPLLLLAGASLAISFLLLHASFSPDASRVPLWVLALSIGVIASAGGSASLLVGDFSGDAWVQEARSSPEFVVVDRGRWSALQEELRRARAGSDSRSASPHAAETLELPEWEESLAVPGTSEFPSSPPDLSPPAPMSVSRGIDSLATEVERLVADLESTAALLPPAPPTGSGARSMPPVTPAPPAVAPTPESAVVRAASAIPKRSEGERPRRPPRKLAPEVGPPKGAPEPQRAPAPPSPSPEDLVATEYRALLAELEERASKVSVRSFPEPGAPVPVPSDARCAGCEARLGPSAQGERCRSCRAPMCGSCQGRSAKEGYPGLCAVCAILEESDSRDRDVRP